MIFIDENLLLWIQFNCIYIYEYDPNDLLVSNAPYKQPSRSYLLKNCIII